MVDYFPLSPWLKLQIQDMEAVLTKAGLPREAWRDLRLDLNALIAHPDRSPEEALGVGWCGEALPPLVKFVREHGEDDEARSVYFAAAIAAAANLALERWQNSEDRFVLGLCHERFWTLRKFDLEGAGRYAMSRTAANAGAIGGRKGLGKPKRDWTKLIHRIVEEVGRDPNNVLNVLRDSDRSGWDQYIAGPPPLRVTDVDVDDATGHVTFTVDNREAPFSVSFGAIKKALDRMIADK